MTKLSKHDADLMALAGDHVPFNPPPPEVVQPDKEALAKKALHVVPAAKCEEKH